MALALFGIALLGTVFWVASPEAATALFALTRDWNPLAIGLIVAGGQLAGMALVFTLGTAVRRRWRWFDERCAKAQARWGPRLVRRSASLALASGVLGVPPVSITSALAPAVGLSASSVLPVAFLGRWVRFAVIAAFAGWVHGRATPAPRDTATGLEFDAAAVASHQPLAGLDRRFFLGVASSAYQTEGGNHNDWSGWEGQRFPDGRPHVADGATAARATDAWNGWRADVAAVQELGANMYRLGVEWSRLEPTEGAWDAEAAAHYREIFRALRTASPQPVTPMVNLWHFTLPRWVAARGGWEWAGAPQAFAAFAGRVAEAFGGDVDWWCTLNEPNVYAAKAYLAAEWPPEVADAKRAARVLAALLRAHGLAAAEIRRHDRIDADADGAATRIGLAHSVRLFDPASRNPLDTVVADAADGFFNGAVPDAVATGEIRVRIAGSVDLREPAPELRGSFDFLGLNYYTRDLVSGRLLGVLGRGRPFVTVPHPTHPRTDMDQEIYPEGFYRALKRFAGYGWPILVTENGMADHAESRRAEVLRRHIFALDQARAEGVNVIGYLYWSLTDNFEWAHGYRGRYGLFTIDFDGDPTLARRATPAVETFRDLASALGLRPTPRR
jgi:beta-glucosidase